MTSRVAFTDLTETSRTPLTSEGASMVYTRYHVASEVAAGRRVLEIACGAGQGLGMIAARAARTVAGDLDEALLSEAQQQYRGRIPLVRFDAAALPFAAAAFDVVLLFEALYYIADADRVFDELVRVLATNGMILIVSANPHRADFIASPRSRHYHRASEFVDALERRGCRVTIEGAYPTAGTALQSVAAVGRRMLQRARLVPRTLRGRALLKRLCYGQPVRLPAELRAGILEPAPRNSLELGRESDFKVMYVTARVGAPVPSA